MTVFARGLLHRLFTRAYLPAGAPGATEDALVDDRLLRTLDPDRRATLIAAAAPEGYRFDISLQGDNETVFLNFNGAGSED